MNRDLQIEAMVGAMQSALRDIVTYQECDYEDNPSAGDKPVPCPCPACSASRALELAEHWRFMGARHERVGNGYSPRETLIVQAWRKYMTTPTGLSADARLASILFGDDNAPIPSHLHPALTMRDWYVATTIVQWLATNVGSCLLGEAGFKYAEYDKDRRLYVARHEKRLVSGLVSGLAVNDAGAMLMTLRRQGDRRGGLWENPGGKIEKGESPEQALAREWQEELGVAVEVGRRLSSAVLDVEVILDLTLYEVVIKRGEPEARQADAIAWWTPAHAVERLPCTPATYAYYQDIVRHLERR